MAMGLWQPGAGAGVKVTRALPDLILTRS